jgi:uncharacterized protein YbcI
MEPNSSASFGAQDSQGKARISIEMAHLYNELFGRGPTKSVSNFARPDLLVCTLENSLTAAERNMVALGEHQRLRDIRMLFQHASDPEFKEAVERLTGADCSPS